MQPLQSNPRPTPPWRLDVVASSMNKVMCECGAIYGSTKAKNKPRGLTPFRCVLCNRELAQTAGAANREYRLIWRPDDDKE
jgi:predicted SprT family Zn-dependent metalloprotease